MPNNTFEGFEDLSSEAIEVQLVEQVTKCRTCNWFWRPPPYGPYPSFDFTENFPEVLRDRTSRQFKDKEYVRSVDGLSRKQAIVNPQILHGCRKAPVMTIGINPNLTGFWPSTQGSRWTYPLFSNFARYAYYYRHRTTHQESFHLDFIKEHIRHEGALLAVKTGRVKYVKRDMVKREMEITLIYEDGEEKTHKQTWDPENHFVLLYDRTRDNVPQFQADDIIGGFIDIPDGVEVPVEQNIVGYYQRVIPIIEQISAFVRSQGYLPNIQMAEDVCQLDMVACASPGWGKSYKIDKKEAVRECIRENAWVIKQLIQSNPKVIIFSGRSAFQMFNQIFKPFVVPSMWDDMDVYGLLKMTARDPHYLEIQVKEGNLDYQLRARIVISPHFSYDANFEPHARFSNEDWVKFESDYPEATTDLKNEERITEPNRDNYRGISVRKFQAFLDKHPVAAIVIIQRLVDPTDMIGECISQEIIMDNITFNETDSHLNRSSGPCRFCVNDSWVFPEGCPYGKGNEEEAASDTQNRVVEYVLQKLEDAIE